MKYKILFLLGFSCIGYAHTCPVVDVEGWDAGVVQRAKKICARTYPDSPCLVRIEKIEENAYQVICGEKVESKPVEREEQKIP